MRVQAGQLSFCPVCGAPWGQGWLFCGCCGRPAQGLGPAEGAGYGCGCGQGWGAYRAGRYELAASLLERGLSCPQHRGENMALLGAIALRQGRARSAWRWLEEAVAMDPGSPLVRLKRAEYWLALGVVDRALGEVEEAARGLEPYSPLWPHLRRALAAIEDYRRRGVPRHPTLPSPISLLRRRPVGRRRGGRQ